jgi:flavin-dependent dehydrogenase
VIAVTEAQAGMSGDEPVTVVGAGPAGLAAAIVLARGGRRVVVREWHPHVGSRFHGDFQGLENWSDERDILQELAAHGIAASFDHDPTRAGVAFDHRGERYAVSSRRPLYYLIRRGPMEGSLDSGLLRQARDAGIEVRFGERVRISGGMMILATGPRVANAIAAGYVFETDMTDGDFICFNDALAPKGYAYLLVRDGRGTVASCMFTGFKQEAEHLRRTVDFFREHAGLRMDNARRFGGFANLRLPRAAVQGGHPVIGEQAGFQDALAGFGLRYALRSGVLAARSLLDGISYEAAWRRELLPLLRAGISNRLVYNLVGERGRSWYLKHRVGRGDTGTRLGRLYRPSAATRLLFPLAARLYRVPLRDPSCDHMDCSCVWCRCARQDRAAEPARKGGSPGVATSARRYANREPDKVSEVRERAG